jgi:DNA polymerase III alpha subunit (gram-positive type)
MKMNERKIAMTDVETTGDTFGVHEILEIGLVVFDQNNFEIVDTLEVKVKPLSLKNAIPAAIEKNGYNEEEWKKALSLKEAMEIYANKTEDHAFCSFNVSFDWGFINDAFIKTGVRNKIDYHRLDLLSMAWIKGLKKSEKWTLKTACEMFSISPEPKLHRALSGAMTAYELFKKLNSK